jgi:leucine dehydrogenase
VVGPANNQLASDHVATLLHRSRVLWAPDYLVSAGGIVSAVARELHQHGPASGQLIGAGAVHPSVVVEQVEERGEARRERDGPQSTLQKTTGGRS